MDQDRVEKTIDRIEAIRARSNTLWMNVVRLAMRVAPVEARAIFDEIEANDEAILRESRWMRSGTAHESARAALGDATFEQLMDYHERVEAKVAELVKRGLIAREGSSSVAGARLRVTADEK